MVQRFRCKRDKFSPVGRINRDRDFLIGAQKISNGHIRISSAIWGHLQLEIA